MNTVLGSGGFNDTSTYQLVLDLEVNDGLPSSSVWAWVQTFVAKMKQLTGRPPIIYVGYYFWKDDVGGTSNLDCPLWIASYTRRHPFPLVRRGMGLLAVLR